MKNNLKNWTLMRLLYLIIGLFIVVQSITGNDWMFAGLGGWITLMPVLNVGCCGTRSCRVPASKSRDEK